ncbi:MAG: DUF488 domain-containing protein [Candidatus Methylomirabilales bacterium]
MTIKVKRVYDPPSSRDGRRFLVDRLWPRGLKRDALSIDDWLKDVGPSDALRRWFAHEPSRWHIFQRRYAAELERRPETWRPLLKAARRGTVTLLYSARNPEHNNAVALKAYMETKLKKSS